MNFWHNWQTAAGLEGMQQWLMLASFIALFLLWIFVPAERHRLRVSIVLLVIACLILLVCAVMIGQGISTNSLFRWLQGTAWLFEGIAIINLASVLVFEVALNTLRVHPPRIMRDLWMALAYIVFVFMLISFGGIDLTSIVATSAVITAIVAFSLQDTLGNVLGGIALQMERTIKVGDWVRIDKNEGQVKEIRWRQTSIETRDGDMIVIPNSVLMKSQVTLIGHRIAAPRQQRRWVHFNVDFRYAPSDVIDAVQNVLRSEPIANVALEPKPDCILVTYKESFAAYAVRYWLTDFTAPDPTDSAVRTRIYFALRRADIPLSIPAQTFFVTEDDEARRERKTNEELERRLQALHRVGLFHMLTDEEMRELATQLHVAPFVRGEFITRQDNIAHWLYIIRRGEAEVRLNAENKGLSEPLATLHDGDIFGEMGLMTGEPRTANIIARTDVQCYKLDKDAFNAIFQRRPEIVEDLSKVLAQRRVELQAFTEGLNDEMKRQRVNSMQTDLLHRIRSFFRL
ncbi:MAG: mechanosensitive ion channel family protein [Pyrinomonadaceae bacterium]